MDFMKLAKQGLESLSDANLNEGAHRTGGHEYNSGDNNSSSADRPDFDEDAAVSRAAEHGSGDRDLFSSAMSFVSSNKHEHVQPVDEEHVVESHRKAYEQNDFSNLTAGSIGSAAALQAFKSFTSGGGGGGKGGQTELISMAMSEASKLFDSSSGGAGGDKQEAVNGAAMTVMKLLVQSKMNTMMGGQNSGGLSGLMGMASKFM